MAWFRAYGAKYSATRITHHGAGARAPVSIAGFGQRRVARRADPEVAANDKKLVSFFRRQNLLNANPLDKMRPPNVFQVRDLLGVWKVRSNPTCHYENQ